MKKQYEQKETIAIHGLSNTACISVLEIDCNNERVFYRVDTNEKKGKVRFSKINNSQSFNTPYGRVKLSECMRVA